MLEDLLQIMSLISSPYTEPPHLLDLDSLEPAYRASALVLQDFQATSQTYADDSYIDSFNIEEIAKKIQDQVGEATLYIVAFRSALRPEINTTANRAVLFDADRRSHAEANALGGLLKYWYGTPAENGHNLATCWWRSAEDARLGGRGKAHRESVAHTMEWYLLWHVEQYNLEVTKDSWNLKRI